MTSIRAPIEHGPAEAAWLARLLVGVVVKMGNDHARFVILILALDHHATIHSLH